MRLSSRQSALTRLQESKAYRAAYVLEHIKNGIAFQIRTLRDDRGWTQGDLGEAMGKPRNMVSRLEDPNYGKFTLTTLLDIAAAFDVGLIVKFVPFSRLLREYEDVSPTGLSAHDITSPEELAALSAWAKECDASSVDNAQSACMGIEQNTDDILTHELATSAATTVITSEPIQQLLFQ